MANLDVILIFAIADSKVTLRFSKDFSVTVQELLDEALRHPEVGGGTAQSVRCRDREIEPSRRLGEFAGALDSVTFHVQVAGPDLGDFVDLGDSADLGADLELSLDACFEEASGGLEPIAAEPSAAPVAAEPIAASVAEPIAAPAAAGADPRYATPTEPRILTRRATVRYYGRMNAMRLFPLVVVLSRQQLIKLVQAGIRQQSSAPFAVAEGSVVRIEPILPGCQCYPASAEVTLDDEESTTRFFVVPQVVGRLKHARVVLTQDGRPLSELNLEVKVTRQTVSLFVGALSFLAPSSSLVLRMLEGSGYLDPNQGTALLLTTVGAMVGSVSPDLLFTLLALLSVLLFVRARPKRRSTEWNLEAGAQPASTG